MVISHKRVMAEFTNTRYCSFSSMVFICPNSPKRLMILKGNLWNDLWRDKKMKGKLHVCRAWACNKWLPKTAEWMGSLRSGFISENCHLLSQSQTRRARLNKNSKRPSCLLIFKGILSGEVCDILIHSSSEILLPHVFWVPREQQFWECSTNSIFDD